MSGLMKSIRMHLIGKPLRNAEVAQQKYGVIWGLPVLSSDAISSVAYACEEILLILVPVLGAASYGPMMGAAGIIIMLLFILILCYRQVIDAYPRGGGAYSVARENLGMMPSLVAASGLVIDYVLTVAVSVSSGVAAITSALPMLEAYTVPMAVGFVLLITIGNLRGLRESSVAFGLPAYVFIITIMAMIVVGIAKALMGQAPQANATAVRDAASGLTLFLFLHAFSSGCSALTGVEAISNSVSNFAAPAQRNAKITLSILGIIVLVVFGGVCLLAMIYKISPMQDVTVVAQIATGVFGGSSFMFFMVQATTAVILLLAANTAYNGLPQLMSLLAEDSFLPKRFDDRGARLVFSNGIIFLAIIACSLIVVFHGQTHLLIPLYATGVFISFTIAQSGMVLHWKRVRGTGWVRRAVINGVGAMITTVVFLIIVATRFMAGAWIAILAIFICSAAMWAMHRHYMQVGNSIEFSAGDCPRQHVKEHVNETKVIVPIAVVDRSFVKTMNYAMTLSDCIEVYHVKTSDVAARRLRTDYKRLDLPYPLVIENAGRRSINEVLAAHIDKSLGGLGEDDTLTVVMPQLVTRWWEVGLHNQTTIMLIGSLINRRNLAIITIPFNVERR